MATKDPSENVYVAVRVRPQSELELESRARIVCHKVPNEPQLIIGANHAFTFDEIYYSDAAQADIFNGSVRSLVEGTLEGRNASVLAYGQTGSGKTYTMGTGFDIEVPEETEGVVPRAVNHLFRLIEEAKSTAIAKNLPMPEFSVKISFVEIYCNDFYDLFAGTGRQVSNVKIVDSRDDSGIVKINISGVTLLEVSSASELMGCLRRGSLDRVTASTDMNATSSRSHAIFSIYLTHRRCVYSTPSSLPAEEVPVDQENPVPSSSANKEFSDFITTTAKFNFVDLAGSERLKRTHATGTRKQEGIDINSGLLALGNVISALGDPTRRSAHVPYRDSKLTRMLQDSLGGNSRTAMIACISPSDSDFLETLNTLKYANRARNIKNKVVVNQDSSSHQIQMLTAMVQKLQLELLQYKQGKREISMFSTETDVNMNELYLENTKLKEQNDLLKKKLKALEEDHEVLVGQLVAASQGALTHTSVSAEDAQDVEGPKGSLPQNVAKQLEDLIRENADLRLKIRSGSHVNLDLSRPTTSSAVPTIAVLSPRDPLRTEATNALLRSKALLNAIPLSLDEPKISITPEEVELSNSEDELLGNEPEDEEEQDPISDAERIMEEDDKAAKDENDVYSSQMKSIYSELNVTIEMQEKLLQALELKEAELIRLKDSYEHRLVQEKKEKETLQKQHMLVQRQIENMQAGDEGSVKMKRVYEGQLKTLQAKINTLTEESKKRERDNIEHDRLASQINELRQSLLESKVQRKKLLDEMRVEGRRTQERDKERDKELVRLRSESAKSAMLNQKLKSEVTQHAGLLKQMTEENKKLKSEITRTHSQQSTDLHMAHTAASASRTRLLKRRSSAKNLSSISSYMATLEGEIEKVVELLAKREEIDRLTKARDIDLKQDRLRCEAELVGYTKEKRDSLVEEPKNPATETDAMPNDDQPSIDTRLSLAEVELERINSEIEILTEQINDGQEELLNMESEGLRLVSGDEPISEVAWKLLGTMSRQEAALVIKRFFCKAVKKEYESRRDKKKLIATEEESNITRRIFQSFVHREGSTPELVKLVKQRSQASVSSLLTSDTYKVPHPSVLGTSTGPPPLIRASSRLRMESTLPLVQEAVSRQNSQDGMTTPEDSVSADLMDDSASSRRGTFVKAMPLSRRAKDKEKEKEKEKEKTPLTTTSITPKLSRKPVMLFAAQPDQYRDQNDSIFTESLRRNSEAIRLRKEAKLVSQGFIKERASRSGKWLTCTRTITGHTDEVFCLAMNTEFLFSGSKDKTIRVWDVEREVVVQTLSDHDYHVRSVATVDTNLYSGAKNTLYTWDTRSFRATHKLKLKHGQDHIHQICADPSRNLLFVIVGKALKVIDTRNMSTLNVVVHKTKLQCMGLLSPRTLATGGWDRMIRLYDEKVLASSSVSSATLSPPHLDTVQCLVPLGDKIISGGKDCCIKRWDPTYEASGELPKWSLNSTMTSAHDSSVNALAALDEAGMFVSGSSKGQLKLWKGDSISCVQEEAAHHAAINALLVTQNVLFSASSDKTIKIWQFHAAPEVRSPLSKVAGNPSLGAKSPPLLAPGTRSPLSGIPVLHRDRPVSLSSSTPGHLPLSDIRSTENYDIVEVDEGNDNAEEEEEERKTFVMDSTDLGTVDELKGFDESFS